MSRRRQNMQHLFSMLPKTYVPRSAFDRSHGYKSTFDVGYLVPFFLDEVLPGDTFNLSANLFARLATPIVPIMDNLYLDTQFFFVPCRLLWEHWENLNGQRDTPDDDTEYLIPQCYGTNVQNGELWDYFGLPTNVNSTLRVSVLPFRAYNLIWNEWYRDENLQEPAVFNRDDKDEPRSNFPLRKRAKRHDYFTSALPWPQKGPAEGVTINLGEKIPVEFAQNPIPVHAFIKDAGFYRQDSNQYSYLPAGSEFILKADMKYPNGITSGFIQSVDSSQNVSQPGLPNPQIHLETGTVSATANLSAATAITINDLRTAFQVQKLFERDARGGTRYTEILRSHFGVISPDARLQRPEYLGGSSTRINIRPVEQTSSSNEITPQGNLAAYGVAGDSFHGFTKSFVEHGFVIGLVSVRADLTYQQGINRLWSRRDRLDHYWPALAHLGEQTVLNKEIYAQGTEDDDKVFGYQERFAEYRYKPALITGKFRSTDPQSLDIWHLAQEFGSLPALNDAFIQENPPLDRVVAVPSEPDILFDSYIRLKCVRPMPVYSVPGFVDHF